VIDRFVTLATPSIIQLNCASHVIQIVLTVRAILQRVIHRFVALATNSIIQLNCASKSLIQTAGCISTSGRSQSTNQDILAAVYSIKYQGYLI